MAAGAIQGPIAALLQQEERQRQQVRQRQTSQGTIPRASTSRKPGQPWAAKPSEPRRSTTPKNPQLRVSTLETLPARRSQTLGHSQSLPGSGKSQPSPAADKQNWEAFHRRSTSFLQERTALIDHLRAAKEEEELQSCTFAPNRSVQSDRPRSGVHVGLSLYERGVEHERRKAERMQQMKQDLFDQEMANCSFQPQRSQSSRRRATTGSSLQDLSISSGSSAATGSYAARAATARASASGRLSGRGERASASHSGYACTAPGGYPVNLRGVGGGYSKGSYSAATRRELADGAGSTGDPGDQFSFTGEGPPIFGADIDGGTVAHTNGHQAPTNGTGPVEDARVLQRRRLLQETLAMDAQRHALPQQPYSDLPLAPPMPQDDWQYRVSRFGDPLDHLEASDGAAMDPVAAAVSRMEGVLLEQLRGRPMVEQRGPRR